MTTFAADVEKELNAMKTIGMAVPDKAFTLARDVKSMAEYESMSVSECADLLVTLAASSKPEKQGKRRRQ